MKISEIEPQNSLGKPIYNYPQFKRWFKNSVAVDNQGRPLVVYHGTGNSFDQFSLDFRSESQGNDQYGPGFYTATDPNAAAGYTVGKNPNIMPLYISIQKPLSEKNRPFSPTIVKKLITSSPEFSDAILNFGDPSWEGMAKVLSNAVKAYGNYDNPLQQLMTIKGDFWPGVSSLKFLALVTKLTGYDGVVVKFNEGGDFYIAWQPTQLKSATGNSGEYSDTNVSIIGEEVDKKYFTWGKPFDRATSHGYRVRFNPFDEKLQVKVYNNSGIMIGEFVFALSADGETVFSENSWVHEPYRNQGIAKEIYSMVHNLGTGVDIVPSKTQTPDGEKYLGKSWIKGSTK